MTIVTGLGAAGAMGFFRRKPASMTRATRAALEGLSEQTLRDIGVEHLRRHRYEVDPRVMLELMSLR